MSFRIKTLLGIVLIESTLLLFLVWSSMDYLVKSNEEALIIRAQTMSETFANSSQNALLSTDLALLESLASQAMQTSDMVYIRFKNNERVMAQSGNLMSLARPFSQDYLLVDTKDGIFDFGVDIIEGGDVFGRVELGLSTEHANQIFADAKQQLLLIAATGMMLVVLFTYLLVNYLTRGLHSLTQVAQAISTGDLSPRIKIKGNDELAMAGRAFNTMSSRLKESQQAIHRSLKESESLARELSNKEQRLSAILTTAVDAIVTIDEQGIIEGINPVGADLFGYQMDELYGQNVSTLMPEPYRSKHDGYLVDYCKTGVASIIGKGREVLGLRKNLSVFPLDLSLSEMEIDGKRMFVGLMRDISERKKIEHEARKNAAIKSAVVEANLDALVTIGLDDRIVEFSSVAEQMFGYRREQVLGKSMPELLIPVAMRSPHRKGMNHYTVTGEGPVLGQRIEVEALRSNGELFPIELTIQVIEVDDNDRLFTAFIRDITDRKVAEAQLLDAKQKAEASSEAKSQFVAHMSHEIRSPLNAVLGSVSLLLDDNLSKEQRLYVQTAQTSGKVLLGLINDILDFSKIEAGHLQLDKQRFSLVDLTSDVADLIAFRARDKQLQTAVVVDPQISDELIGDPGRLRQILNNLADNALKFTEQGAVVLSIEEIDHNEDKVTLQFSVRDSGIGIPKEAQALLFDEFQQVDNSDSTRYGGTGLGLSICKGLCQAMGGVIGLDSEPGRGSCFWVKIPFDKNVRAKAMQKMLPKDQHLPKLLIVGLHPLVRQALQIQHQATRPCAQWAGSLDDAWEQIDEGTDAVIIDATTHKTDELLKLSRRAHEFGVRHLILFAPKVTKEVEERLRAGNYDLLLMPFSLTRIMAVLNTDASTERRSVERGNGASSHIKDSTVPSEHQDEGKARILLAEDSPANQIVAKAMLSKAGYPIDIAENGQQAVDAFMLGHYELILMDLRMPVMNGLEATATIRADNKGKTVPIIAMTANASREDVDRCLAGGMNDFVAKPVDRKKLFEVLQRYLPALPIKASEEPSPRSETTSDVKQNHTDILLDENAITMLAEDTSPETVPSMVKLFIDEIVSRAGRVTEGMDSLSMELLEDEAHTLKSCAGTFGAIRLQRFAEKLEAACRDDDRKMVENMGNQLAKKVLPETLAAFRNRFDYLDDT